MLADKAKEQHHLPLVALSGRFFPVPLSYVFAIPDYRLACFRTAALICGIVGFFGIEVGIARARSRLDSSGHKLQINQGGQSKLFT